MVSARLRKVLIANRAEIAVRIAQACRELGIRAVAVYSEADRDALHVRRADEAYLIGPAAASESYLNVERILAVARQSGADAIHPGYGFLAENADFADACLAAGLAFIGPPPKAIRLAGDKVASKRLAAGAGVPVVPGFDGEQQDDDRLMVEARRIGFPVLVKAAAGGGGRGMRVVHRVEEVAEALAGARREAASAFGDDRLFLERLVAPARHVEIQVLADRQGNVVHLFERECSIQRRHQKIVEESPSPALTPELRAKMTAAAVRVAKAVGYENAGTVEFLVGPSGEFYFLEMNTRLQVEHPVTESITGLDLVHLQLRIAAGEPLPFGQDAVTCRGHAIEVRIYAEDPASGFLPSTGRLVAFEPPLGAGLRNDVGVEAGGSVGLAYDPMLAKLIVHAPDRGAAVERLAWALRRYPVLGVTTNVPFLLAIAEHPEFRAGRTFVDFIPTHFGPTPQLGGDLPPNALLAAAGFDLFGGRQPRSGSPWAGPWRLGGGAIELRYRWRDGERTVRARRLGGERWAVESGGEAVETELARFGDRVVVRTEDAIVVAWVAETEHGLELFLDGDRYVLTRPGSLDLNSATRAATGGAHGLGLSAPMPGVVVKLHVREGEPVRPLQTVLVLEAMKMEHTIQAPHGGVVRKIHYREGDLVPGGATLVEIEEP